MPGSDTGEGTFPHLGVEGGEGWAAVTYAARAEHECCAQTLNLMNCIIKFKNKFKTLLTPCNGLLLEYRAGNGSLARRKSTPLQHASLAAARRRVGAGGVGGGPTQPLLPAPTQVKSRPLQAGHRGMQVSKVRLCLAPMLKSKSGFLSRLNDFF